MRTQSLIGSVAVLLGLLIAAGLAARSHPLSTGGSVSGRTTDILMVVAFAVVAALMIALAIESHRPDSTARRQWGVGDVLFALILLAALVAGSYGLGRVFGSAHSRQHGVPCVQYERAHSKPTSNCAGPVPPPVAKRAQHPAQATSRSSWFVIGAIVALLLGGGALFVLGRRRSPVPRAETDDGRGVIVDALDLSIDDLRQEPDARRAIIAAYARMEAAFATVGMPRRASEAPHEFLVRSLLNLDASADAASRLTDLFELAKFSHHAATLPMRDDAIDALVALRDELTRTLGAGAAKPGSERKDPTRGGSSVDAVGTASSAGATGSWSGESSSG